MQERWNSAFDYHWSRRPGSILKGSLTGADDTSLKRVRMKPLWCTSRSTYSNQLLDFGLDARVSHVFLQSRRVALGLLQDALHDRVLQNRENLDEKGAR